MQMKASLPIPYAIGETVWAIDGPHQTMEVPCDECAGTKVITMIQGNGERVDLDCARCGPGYQPPTGWITMHVPQFRPVPFVCNRVEVNGDQIRYSMQRPDASCYSSRDAKDLFVDEEVCRLECIRRTDEYLKEQSDRRAAQIAESRRKNTFNATYWRGIIKRLESDLEVARARLSRCREVK